jgi:hypothetical protein
MKEARTKRGDALSKVSRLYAASNTRRKHSNTRLHLVYYRYRIPVLYNIVLFSDPLTRFVVSGEALIGVESVGWPLSLWHTEVLFANNLQAFERVRKAAWSMGYHRIGVWQMENAEVAS